jgi:diguanylate cyclase (GGDEF)-like protein
LRLQPPGGALLWLLGAAGLGLAALLGRGRRSRYLAAENRRLEEENRRLEHESHTDSLTGLRNRRFFLETIEHDVALVDRLYSDVAPKAGGRDGRDFLFLFFDVDDFKVVNDRYGHTVGDRVLVQLRWILEGAFRESDNLIRWGGDEFLVVGRFTDRGAAEPIAERLRAQIADHPFQLGDGRTVRLTCSIGFACYPFLLASPTRLNWREVLNLADRAQYVAKHGGRNGWVGLGETPKSAELPPEELTERIRRDTEGLMRDGTLAVRSSRHLPGLRLRSV